jgi:hypothetical protein
MRWRRLLIILTACAAVIAIVAALIPREPKYDGRTLSEWIKDAAPHHSPDPETTKAIDAVRHIGTNGLPWLIKWISAKKPPDWQLKLTTANARLPRWIRLRLLPSLFGFNSYYAHRRVALDGFLILGAEATPAVPDLLQIIASSPNGSPASGALDSIGVAAVPAALNVLTNRANASQLRVAAGVWISYTDPKAENETVVALMAQCLRDKNPNLIRVAAGILARRRAEPELVVPLFVNCLTNSNPDIRYGAARGLSQYGERATSAVPALVIALKDTDPLVRQVAEDALFEIDPVALEKASPGLAELKKHWRRTLESGPQQLSK